MSVLGLGSDAFSTVDVELDNGDGRRLESRLPLCFGQRQGHLVARKLLLALGPVLHFQAPPVIGVGDGDPMAPNDEMPKRIVILLRKNRSYLTKRRPPA